MNHLPSQYRVWIEREILDVLASGRWVPWERAIDRVRKRWGHIADRDQVSRVMGELWDADRVAKRTVQVPAGLGSIYETIGQTQVRIVKEKRK